MKIPNGNKAVVDARKLKDYCLNPSHEIGKHKARVFKAALDLTIDDWEFLRSRLLEAARSDRAIMGRKDKYGERYIMNFPIEHHDKSATVQSVWIVEGVGQAPRLITCRII